MVPARAIMLLARFLLADLGRLWGLGLLGWFRFFIERLFIGDRAMPDENRSGATGAHRDAFSAARFGWLLVAYRRYETVGKIEER